MCISFTLQMFITWYKNLEKFVKLWCNIYKHNGKEKNFKKRNITYFVLLKYPWIAWFDSRVPEVDLYFQVSWSHPITGT